MHLRQGLDLVLFWPGRTRYVRQPNGLTTSSIGMAMENRRNSFEFEDLLACGRGEMFSEGPQLPLPPMLMFDRISELPKLAANTARAWCARHWK